MVRITEPVPWGFRFGTLYEVPISILDITHCEVLT